MKSTEHVMDVNNNGGKVVSVNSGTNWPFKQWISSNFCDQMSKDKTNLLCGFDAKTVLSVLVLVHQQQ